MTHILKPPQRLTRPASPGALLKRPMEAAKRIKLREAMERDPVYIQRIQECPCLDCGLDPCGEAAHVRMASGTFHKASGMGKTPDDKWALPLCRSCHQIAKHAQHKGSEREFWYRLGINPLITASRLYQQRSDLVAMRAVIYLAIAERESRMQSIGATSTGGHDDE